MGTTWVLLAPDLPHVGPVNLANLFLLLMWIFWFTFHRNLLPRRYVSIGSHNGDVPIKPKLLPEATINQFIAYHQNHLEEAIPI